MQAQFLYGHAFRLRKDSRLRMKTSRFVLGHPFSER